MCFIIFLYTEHLSEALKMIKVRKQNKEKKQKSPTKIGAVNSKNCVTFIVFVQPKFGYVKELTGSCYEKHKKKK